MQVKSIADSAILSTVIFVFKTFVLSIFEWTLKTGFPVHTCTCTCFKIWNDLTKMLDPDHTAPSGGV